MGSNNKDWETNESSRKMANANAYAPYSPGASQRASKIPTRKFDPEISPWSRTARPPFVAMGMAFPKNDFLGKVGLPREFPLSIFSARAVSVFWLCRSDMDDWTSELILYERPSGDKDLFQLPAIARSECGLSDVRPGSALAVW